MSKNHNFLLGILLFLLIISIGLTRFWNLTALPPAPYEEEVALGYDAYSLFKTGKDHHGNPWPIIALESFGDWKPALYAYTIVPFIAVLDLNVWAVRLPSALAGVAIIIATATIAHKIGSSWKWAAVVATFSPWLIFFSRAAWEVNLATALITSAVALLLWSVAVQKIWRWAFLLLSAFLLSLSVYTYHSARVLAPLLALGMGLWLVWPVISKRIAFRKIIQKMEVIQTAVFGIACLLVMGPILINMTAPAVRQRAQETTFINTAPVLERTLELQNAAGDTWLAKKIFHPYLVTLATGVNNYLLHLDPAFLFVKGDINPRHSSQQTALFYWFDAVFLVIGLYWFWTKRSRTVTLLLWWLLAGIVPIAITKDVPHALRLLTTAPVWLIIIASGYSLAASLVISLSKRYLPKVSRNSATALIPAFLLLLVLSQWLGFWLYYSTIYPIRYSASWQYGNEEMIAKMNTAINEYSPKAVFVSRGGGRPLMYYWFYSKTDPIAVQSLDNVRMNVGETLEFNQIHALPLDPVIDTELLAKRPALYVVKADEVVPAGAETIVETEYPDHKPNWKLYVLK